MANGSQQPPATTPAQLKAMLLAWIFCVVNYDVFTNIGPADLPGIAQHSGLDSATLESALAKAKQLDGMPFAGGSPLKNTASVFAFFAEAADYVPPSGKVCGTIDEIYSALEA